MGTSRPRRTETLGRLAVMRRRSVHEALAFDGDFVAAGYVELR